MLAEELWSLIKNPGHLLSCCVDQYHLGNVDNVCLIWLFRKVSLVDVQRLQVDATHELAVRFAKFLDKTEDFVGVFLMLKLLQVVEQLVEYLGEEGALAHCCFAKEEVNLFTQSWIVLVKVEQDDFDLIVVECQHFVETLDTMQGSDSDFIDFVVEHVNQEVETLGSDLTADFAKAAHGLDTC